MGLYYVPPPPFIGAAQPVTPKTLDPPRSGPTPTNPVFGRPSLLSTLVAAWEPPDYRPQGPVRFIRQVVISAPLFNRYPLDAVLRAWAPPQPVPVVAINLDPPRSGPIPTNPPFVGGAQIPEGVLNWWVSVPPLPYIRRLFPLTTVTTIVTLDSTIAIEFLSTQRLDWPTNTESLTTVFEDGRANIESIASVSRDGGAQAETLSTQRNDGVLNLEVVSTQQIDARIYDEVVTSVVRNSPTNEEILGGVQSNAPVQEEWLGLVSVTVDGIVPLEWSGTIVSSLCVVPIEELAGVVRTLPVTAEVLATALRDAPVGLEWLGSITRDGTVSTESTGLLITDRSMVVELLHGVQTDGSSVSEVIASVLADKTLPMEVLQTINLVTASGIIQIEWTLFKATFGFILLRNETIVPASGVESEVIEEGLGITDERIE